MFEWVKGNVYTLNVTLYTSNITLNAAAASYFSDVRWVMIGFDKEKKQVDNAMQRIKNKVREKLVEKQNI